ncbi:hypothetical protein [Cohnella sp. REN36]|uniref:hypothetical protein n=1 Tax=Cohnella sp. REN36 TaxID=2887347 RepID=UPI001D135A56|nr:hypothetical protein [Cohnella sp. REN36]MCC3377147.1 hypothetical protein [Cohnella sp. REN36]
MTPHEYLQSVLEEEKFDINEEPEIKEKRDEVEELMRTEYGNRIVSFKYSGSIAKYTAIKTSKDMDLAIHFKHDAFSTLKEMYDSIKVFLEKHYTVREQRVSLGLDGLNVDVVPGRRISKDDLANNDVNLYRSDTATSIKTNIEIHKEHVRNSDSREIIKLIKIWRERWGLKFKSFAVELLVIKALDGFASTGLDNKVKKVLNYIKDEVETVNLVDPANSNNNVADIIDYSRKLLFKTTATTCLSELDNAGSDKDKLLSAWKFVYKDNNQNESNSAPTNGFIMATQDWKRQPDRRHG